MNTEQLIANPIPLLQPEFTGNQALAIMEENNIDQLPVVTDDTYIGLVRENDLLDWTHTDEPLSRAEFLNFKPAVLGSGHPFEALRMAHDLDLSVLPVVDRDHKYLGAVTHSGLLKYITENSGISSPGGILVLEIAPRDYTLVAIARICENEDVMIMNTMVHTNDKGMLEVTLKLNRSSVEALVSSFERYNYHVKEYFGEENHDDDIAGKYNLLMNYINM